MKLNIKAHLFNRRAEKSSEKIITSLDIKEGNTVADLGSGGGFFTYRFSRIVGPDGMVFAVDTDDIFLSFVKNQTQKKEMSNVTLVLADENNPNLFTESCDLVFIRNVFHHIAAPVAYFQLLRKSLKSDGRIAIIEWKPGRTFGTHNSTEEKILTTMKSAGFFAEKSLSFLNKQYYIVFRPQ